MLCSRRILSRTRSCSRMAPRRGASTKSSRQTSSSTSRRRRACATASKIRAPISIPISSATFNVLELVRAFSPKHFLLASTSSVYGANEKIPFEESDHTDHPLTLYAATKKATEVMAHSYAHLWKIPTTAFRFFTVYGPWGRPDMALFKFTKGILERHADRDLQQRRHAARLHLYRRSRRGHRPAQ